MKINLDKLEASDAKADAAFNRVPGYRRLNRWCERRKWTAIAALAVLGVSLQVCGDWGVSVAVFAVAALLALHAKHCDERKREE